MILLQNPNIPTSVNPVEIDSAIIDIKSELESGLTWLTNGYGRAFKNLDITNGERVYFPEIYLGKQNGSYRYTNISPDNDKQGQCFFYVRRETISEYQTGMYSFLNYDVALIFSVNMELINSTLTETEVFQQILVAQVRDVLTRQILGKSYVLKVNTVEFLFEDVFREFNLSEQSTMEKSPLSHFRFNISVKMPETCPVPVLPVTTCYSMDLDGVNDLIQAPINTAFDLVRTDSITFECWVKFDSLGVINRLISKYGGLGARGILWQVEGVELRFDLQNNGGLNGLTATTTGANITVNVWYHLAVTYDGSEDTSGVSLYVNGIIQTKISVSNTLSDSILVSNNLQIGGLLPTGGGFSDGVFNYVRIWKTELTPAEILFQYNSGVPVTNAVQSANLILESNSGNEATWNGSEFDIADLTGITSGYQTVNMEIGDRIEDCPIPVIPCYSLLFDGVNEYIQAPLTVGIFDIVDSFSFSGWIKRTGGSFSSLFSKLLYTSSVTQDGYRCYITNTGITVNLYGGGTSSITVESVGSVTLNQWSNVTVTYDGSGNASGVNIYIDGVLMAKNILVDTFTGTMLNVRPLTIGGQPTATNPLYWLGNIAMSRMWDTELTPVQVVAEYNGGQILIPSVQGSNLILETDINNATFDGSDWQIPDTSGTTSGYQSVNMEIGDRIEDCPS